MHKVDKIVLSEVVKRGLHGVMVSTLEFEVVKEGFMKEVTLLLDTEGQTRQWGKEAMREEG